MICVAFHNLPRHTVGFCCFTGLLAELQTLTFDQTVGRTLGVGQATFDIDDVPADAEGDSLLDLLDSVS